MCVKSACRAYYTYTILLLKSVCLGGSFTSHSGSYVPNEAIGLIAILTIMLISETRPLPNCSLICSKTGIMTSDDFVGPFLFQTGVRALMRPLC